MNINNRTAVLARRLSLRVSVIHDRIRGHYAAVHSDLTGNNEFVSMYYRGGETARARAERAAYNWMLRQLKG
jgi:hypothetical protein